MKLSIVPAQITSVEDRIAANLNFSQILLLSIPLFLAIVIFFSLPPFGIYSTYKLILVIFLAVIFSSLAIRIHDKLVIDLIKLRLSYFLRPRIYVYQLQPTVKTFNFDLLFYKKQSSINLKPDHRQLSVTQANKSLKLLTNNNYQVVFHLKSGGLVVKVNNS